MIHDTYLIHAARGENTDIAKVWESSVLRSFSVICIVRIWASYQNNMNTSAWASPFFIQARKMDYSGYMNNNSRQGQEKLR